MSAEIKKVLEMLTEGKITSADAERLLEKVSGTSETSSVVPEAPSAGTSSKRYLRVLIERPLGSDVNVRVPLSFVRSGVKFAGILPPKVIASLAEEGIDPEILSRHAQESIDQLHVDLETKTGKRVRVFCE